MSKKIVITESQLKRVLDKIVSEEKVINESQANAMAQKAMEDAKSGQKNEPMMKAIVDCIKSNRYSHLMVVTTGFGATALGALAALFSSGVGAPAALLLMSAGVIISGIEGMMTTPGSGRGSVTEELQGLYNCLKAKKVI